MMTDVAAPKNWPRLGTLLLILALQTMLLFYNLNLLPMWGDESFTVKTVQLQPGEIARVLAGDMYPPLYYVLAHYWIQIPWPTSVLMKARALSIVFLLLATVAFDRLWLRDFDGGVRIWFLCLWTCSPFLVLYSRMARYYTLQLLLCCLVVHSAVRLIGDPRSKRHLLLYTVTCVLLLYVHYLPGVAMIGAFNLVTVYHIIRQRKKALWKPITVSNLLIACAYAPWLPYFFKAASRVATAHPYSVVSRPFVEHAITVTYLFLSFMSGEIVASWTLILATILAPIIARRLYQQYCPGSDWKWLVLLAAALGYAGAKSWVGFAFVPARMAFLYPFFLLLLFWPGTRLRAGRHVVAGSLLCLSAAAVHSYFQKEGFLNKGYLIPFDQIARVIADGASSKETLVILFGNNPDTSALTDILDSRISIVRAPCGANLYDHEQALQTAKKIWYVCSVECGEAVRLDAARFKHLQTRRFVAYSNIDKFTLKMLGRGQPSHVLELVEVRRLHDDIKQASPLAPSASAASSNPRE